MSEEGGGDGEGGAALVEGEEGEPPLGGASGRPASTCKDEEEEEEDGPPAEEEQEEASRGGDVLLPNERRGGSEDCSSEEGATKALPSGESGKAPLRSTHSNCSSEEGAMAAPSGGSVKSQQQAMHSNCSSDGCIPTPSCRICFQGAEQGELLNPCRCDGSVRYTHQTCLLKWISERGCWTCELCCYRFHVLPINMKTPWQWQSINMTLVEKVQMVAVVLGSVFLVSSISWLLWSALSPQAVWQRRDVLFQICYAMYGFMDLVCVGLIVHEGAAVHNVFMRWRAVNLHWDVQGYDKAQDMEETATDHHRTLAPPRTLWLPLVTLGPHGGGGGPLHPTHTQLSGGGGGGGPHVPWTSWLCFPCPSLVVPAAGDGLAPDGDSGEMVIRVTSV